MLRIRMLLVAVDYDVRLKARAQGGVVSPAGRCDMTREHGVLRLSFSTMMFVNPRSEACAHTCFMVNPLRL